VGGPAVIKNGRTIYFANPIFSEYNAFAPRWEKQLFLTALGLLLPDPLVWHAGPTTLQVTVNEQPDERRWIVHLRHRLHNHMSGP
jgi:hypothetical protein